MKRAWPPFLPRMRAAAPPAARAHTPRASLAHLCCRRLASRRIFTTRMLLHIALYRCRHSAVRAVHRATAVRCLYISPSLYHNACALASHAHAAYAPRATVRKTHMRLLFGSISPAARVRAACCHTVLPAAIMDGASLLSRDRGAYCWNVVSGFGGAGTQRHRAMIAKRRSLAAGVNRPHGDE